MSIAELVAAENAVGFDVVNIVGFVVNSVVGMVVADNTVADLLVAFVVGYIDAEKSVVGFLVAETVNNVGSAVVENVVDYALDVLRLLAVE